MSNFSALAKNKDSQPSTLNLGREIQEGIMICKTQPGDSGTKVNIKAEYAYKFN